MFSKTWNTISPVSRQIQAQNWSKFIRNYSLKVSSPTTKVTTLKNGLRVATEETGSQSATVGIWIDSGSAYETPQNNGVAHFLEHMLFKGTANRTKESIEEEVENLGSSLNAYTSREQTVYFAKAFSENVPQAVDLIADVLQNSKLEPSLIEQERGTILREKEEVDNIYEEAIFDYLHAAAFQGTSHGLTILGPEENIKTLKRNDIVDFVNKNYTAGRMVLVGTGGVDHESLVRLAEQKFSGLKPSSGNHRVEKPTYTGSSIKVENEDMHDVHIAIGMESVGWTHEDFYGFLVLQAIVGNWSLGMGSAATTSSRLGEILQKESLAYRYQSFSTNYNKTGLFGGYVIGDPHKVDNLIFEICNEWVRLGSRVNDIELERAKNQVKASTLLQLDGSFAKAEDVGRQLLNHGRKVPVEEIFSKIESIRASDINRLVNDYIVDQCPTVIAIGDLSHEFPDYNQIRGWLYHNRF